MSKRSAEFLIEDIQEACEKIERYTLQIDNTDAFLGDEKTSDAVVRNLEIIGEAANRLPLDFKKEHEEIEWEKIVGLRHRIVHEYFGVDLRLIWEIIKTDIPPFKDALERIRRKTDS